ncbi:hypothetical protein PENSPDRAFT_748976 [Peniophora sp. CONT]|nr:hypothetical protein PENSPDRAFT_748976 [Peniophora sp. CONT]
MSMPKMIQFKASTESHVAFARLLRSSPTAAIDHYRTLHTSSSSSSSTNFVAATQVFMAAVTYKDWEAHVSTDEPVVNRSEFLKGFSVGVESISTDVWNAIVGTELPLFWLDIALKKNPVHDPVHGRKNNPGSHHLHLYMVAGACEGERRDRIPISFARDHFTKFNDLCTILWQSRTELAPNMIVNLLARLAHDLTHIHAHYKLPARQLNDGRLAHLTLWTLSNGNRTLLMSAASERDLEGFNAVSSSIHATRGQKSHTLWLDDVVKAIGPDSLMDALASITFRSSKINGSLAVFANVMVTMIRRIPECLAMVCRDPMNHILQSSRALSRQVEGNSRMFPVPARWAQNVNVWETLYRLCLLPYDGLASPSRARTRETARLLFDFQSRGVTMMLEIWDQKVAQMASDPVSTARGMAMVDERLREVYQQTLFWLADHRAGLHEKKGSAVAFQKAYADEARESWLSTTKLLRDAQQKHGSEESHERTVRYWAELGRFIGLREAAGLLQLDRTCSNPSCQYHLVPAEKSLSMCKGCQEVRYCSRECQRSDWKGRHREQCRRVKEAGP